MAAGGCAAGMPHSGILTRYDPSADRSSSWLVAAAATSPTTATAIATPPSSGGPWTAYTFIATPVKGGKAIVVTCSSPSCSLKGLQPTTEYAATVVVKDMSGKQAPGPNTLNFATPSKRREEHRGLHPFLPLEVGCSVIKMHFFLTCSSASIVQVTTLTSETADLTAKPEPTAVQYQFLIRPFGQPTATPVLATSPTPTINIDGLKPGQAYSATVIVISAAGQQTPAGNSIAFNMPLESAPTLIAADSTGPTQGKLATVPPKSGGPWKSYTFTSVPRDGGAPVIATCPTLDCMVEGLTPATAYDVTIVAFSQSGKKSPASNSLSMVTPAAG